MIAVALSGGADSAAAAIILHESGFSLCGITGCFGETNPGRVKLDKAEHICRYLGIKHHVLDVRREFESVKRYFCNEYLAGNTPNPCVVCNRDIKFGLLLERAKDLGADGIATGHYTQKGFELGRYYVARAREKNSQEYFLGLLSQDALRQSIFPLEDTTKEEAYAIVAKSGIEISRNETSQDVCFLDSGGYAAFIGSYTKHGFAPGPIISSKGDVIGRHAGALNYTIGQRRGLGMGFGRRVYVLGIDMARNAVTVGDLDEWPYQGFVINEVNYMKAAVIDSPVEARVKVRYRQHGEDTVVEPCGSDRLRVLYKGLFAPGQLAVAYDRTEAVLFAGIITSAVLS